jgi:hypothetical protein
MRLATEDDVFALEGMIRGGPTKVRTPRHSYQSMPQPTLPPYPKPIIDLERRMQSHRRPKRMAN